MDGNPGIEQLFTGLRVSSSGLRAERMRMDVIAENIANARTTRTPDGGPYRRKVVHFESILRESGNGASRAGGIRAEVAEDHESGMVRILDPGHPDADADGMVTFPNVNTVMEMADLITAMRAYEANLTAQENFVRMAERALELAR